VESELNPVNNNEGEDIEKIPAGLEGWIIIDQRVERLGNGSYVHQLTQAKRLCFDIWQAFQYKPDNASIKESLNRVWRGFILDLKQKERERAKEKLN